MPQGYINGKPDVSWWITQIRKGIDYRKKYAHESKWSTWRNYYRGQWKPGIMPVNIFFKMLRSTVPRVYFRNPRVSVVTKRPGADALARARILERVDNKMIRRMKVKGQIKGIVQDAFLFGKGVGKLGYGAEYTPTPDDAGTASPVKNGKVEYQSTVEPNMPWFMRVPTGAFITPAGVSSLDDVRWVAHWIRRPLEDVKDDPRFKHVKNLTPSSKGSDMQAGGATLKNTDDQSTDMIDLVEIRDKKMQKVIVLAPYATERVLYFETDDLQVHGDVPFYDVTFNPDDEQIWGVSDSQILEPYQLELNENRTKIMQHRRMTIMKLFYKKGSITQDQVEKILSDDVGAAIETVTDPELAVKIMESLTIPPELLAMEDRILSDVREILGFSRNEAGEFQQGSRKPTATEVQAVSRANAIRVDERRDIVADMLVDVIDDMHHIIFTHWGEDQIIDVAGPDGAPVWVRFKGDMLKSGRYEVSIDPDSGTPETRDVRRTRAIEEYGILKENPLVDPNKLTNYLVNEMGTVSHDDLLKVAGAPGSQENPVSVDQFAQQFQGGR